MARYFLALASLCVVSTTASAKIGETRAQIEARMGASTATSDGQVVYSKSGFMVAVTYQNGFSVAETVGRPLDAHSARLSDGEVDGILAAYGSGFTWDKNPSSNVWRRTDGKVTAEGVPDGRITFMDAQFARTVAAQRDELEKQHLAEAFGPPPTPIPGSWIIPGPPYPSQGGRSQGTRKVRVRIRTDAAGKTVSVEILQGTGSDVLDRMIQTWGQAKWSGPPNATHEAEFEYRLQ